MCQLSILAPRIEQSSANAASKSRIVDWPGVWPVLALWDQALHELALRHA